MASSVLIHSAADFLPRERSLQDLRAAAASCQGCALYMRATQTVFGEGRPHAEVMLVGEEPGDREDVLGRPFVGPAGRLLDQALERAGIDRARAYLTNAVKHFKWEPRGRRRLHVKPAAQEISACRPWLEAEIHAVQPRVLVCLGATAAQSLLGSDFRVTKHRGEIIRKPPYPIIIPTVHPSSILRAGTPENRHWELERFIADLSRVASFLQEEESARGQHGR